MQNVIFRPFQVNNEAIPLKKEVKYLGHYVREDFTDDRDIMRQRQYLYAKGNMLKKRFYMCSTDVKVKSFRTYCSSMYTSQLWWDYKSASMSKLIVAYCIIMLLGC